VRAKVQEFDAAFRGRVGIRFAIKCSPLPGVLTTIAEAGGSFEIASAAEFDLAVAAGARAADICYSNPVKPPEHIARTFRGGVRRFVADGSNEIEKLAVHAPGSEVVVRVRVADASSAFPLSGKFGAELAAVPALLAQADRLGLDPVGLTFHVGSQCVDPAAWASAIAGLAPLFRARARAGAPFRLLNIGGGFPARYREPVPTFATIAELTLAAIDALPYVPEEIVAEPGRSLAAEAGVLVSRVIGREQRAGRPWVFLDVGAYNGLMEAAQTDGTWRFPVVVTRGGTGERLPMSRTVQATLTGPSCDPSDTILRDVTLPADIEVGDRVLIAGTGAYTLAYAAAFNGFPPPTPLMLP
jgi:ornithine decarboxylase